jgi:hypothetical protein
MDPDLPVKTNASGVMITKLLDIDDVNGLAAALLGFVTNPVTADLDMNSYVLFNPSSIRTPEVVNLAGDLFLGAPPGSSVTYNANHIRCTKYTSAKGIQYAPQPNLIYLPAIAPGIFGGDPPIPFRPFEFVNGAGIEVTLAGSFRSNAIGGAPRIEFKMFGGPNGTDELGLATLSNILINTTFTYRVKFKGHFQSIGDSGVFVLMSTLDIQFANVANSSPTSCTLVSESLMDTTGDLKFDCMVYSTQQLPFLNVDIGTFELY